MYAIPKNGFLPPNKDVVLKIIRFEPSNALTSYAEMIYVSLLQQKQLSCHKIIKKCKLCYLKNENNN